MCAGHRVASENSKVREEAFKAEFTAALDELVGKIRFRGSSHRGWIAEQIVLKLVNEPMVRDEVKALLCAQSERRR